MSIEHRLRDIRSERGMSQEELAERVNVSRQTISKWENGAAHPSGDNLAALSRVFDLPMDALVNDDWTPPQEPDPVVVEVQVEVPVEIPAPRNYRLWALVAALVLVAGIAIGVLLFREPPEVSVQMSETEGEVIGDISAFRHVPILPME